VYQPLLKARTRMLQSLPGFHVERAEGEERQKQHEGVQAVIHQQPVRCQPLRTCGAVR
jgi:hypothetical protein